MYKRILVPINGGPASELAVNEAIKIAQGNATIRLLYVLEEVALPLAVESYDYASSVVVLETTRKSAKGILKEAENIVRRTGMTVETALIEDLGKGVVDMINNDAQGWSADLMVIGTHGRTGLTRLLMGSVAEGVVREASIPVLVIRS